MTGVWVPLEPIPPDVLTEPGRSGEILAVWVSDPGSTEVWLIERVDESDTIQSTEVWLIGRAEKSGSVTWVERLQAKVDRVTHALAAQRVTLDQALEACDTALQKLRGREGDAS